MRGILLALVLLIFFTGAYLYWQNPGHVTNGDITAADTSQATRNNRTAADATSGSTSDQEHQQLREEARQYVAEITKHSDDPVEVESADDFVNRDEPISLFPEKEYETQTINELKENIKPDAPLTIVRQQEQVEMTTAKELLAEHGGALNTTIRVLEGGNVKETTVDMVLKNLPNPDSPISVIRKTENLEVTTLRELMENETLAPDEPLKVVHEPYRLKTTTVGELLMGEKTASDNSIFYVRNVTDDDVQGLWGIVHNGLVKNFASGIAIRRGQQVHSYQVNIPENADERLADHSSSFLGKMIDQKTRESYVYNYEQGKMGKNPNLVHPGQEVVIIGFTAQELYKIYEHFVTRSESRS